MKFEAQLFKPNGEPPELARFFQHYNLVCKYLIDFNANPLKLGADVALPVQQVTLIHNQPSQVNHRQGTRKNVVFCGRVEMFNISASTQDKITVVPKLLTTSLATEPTGRLTQKIYVKDPALFQVGDKVLLGSNFRTIENITGNEFTLDENFMYANIWVVSLALETVTALIF